MRKIVLSFVVLVLGWGISGVGLQNELGTWSSAVEMPTARKQITNSVINIDGNVYVLGGVTSEGTITDIVEIYDPQTNTWRNATPMPLGLWRTMVAHLDGKIYVIGGYQSTTRFPFNPSNRVFEYDLSNDTWSEKAALPGPRGMGAAVVLNGRIHLLAGAFTRALRDHLIYDPVEDRWSDGPPLNEARSGLGAGVIDGKIYAAGGYILGNGVVSQKTAEVFDPETNEWTSLPDMPDTRHGISAAMLDNKLYVFGGLPVAVSTHTFVFDPASETWSELADMPTGLTMAGAAAADGSVYVMGGGPSGLGRTDGVNLNQVFTPPSE